ncbi:Gp15 family bacteriophage protein [Blautia faecis]|uniref:Gp15 family bacteriophage protein n=1 Tax=Blautia faecis TaxID=871665 RepID=UPI002ED1D0CF
MIDDFDLIASSFQSQYGLRLSKEIPAGMSWDEFSDLLSGIGPDTALGRIVAIRAEENEEILKHFTPEQRRIRREWRTKQAMKVSEEDRDKFLEAMKQAFIDMAGGVNG